MERSKKIPSNEFSKGEMRVLIEKLGFLTSHVLHLIKLKISMKYYLGIFHVLSFEFYRENIRKNLSMAIFHLHVILITYSISQDFFCEISLWELSIIPFMESSKPMFWNVIFFLRLGDFNTAYTLSPNYKNSWLQKKKGDKIREK